MGGKSQELVVVCLAAKKILRSVSFHFTDKKASSEYTFLATNLRKPEVDHRSLEDLQISSTDIRPQHCYCGWDAQLTRGYVKYTDLWRENRATVSCKWCKLMLFKANQCSICCLLAKIILNAKSVLAWVRACVCVCAYVLFTFLVRKNATKKKNPVNLVSSFYLAHYSFT